MRQSRELQTEEERQQEREDNRDRWRQIGASQTDEQREQLCILSYASSTRANGNSNGTPPFSIQILYVKLSLASFDYAPPGRRGREVLGNQWIKYYTGGIQLLLPLACLYLMNRTNVRSKDC